MELQSYEYTFKVENSVRAQLAGILTYQLHEKVIKVPNVRPLPPPPSKVLSNAYTLFFDGVFRRATRKVGGGLVLVNPEGEVIMKEHVTLDGSTSNNEAEYDILISGLKICLAQKIRRLMVKGDAFLILKQTVGTPLEIVSDNGPGFRRGLLTEICEEIKISHRHSTPYYPQSNGLEEKANGIIAGTIRKMVESKPKRWDNFLDRAIWTYRTTYRDATQFTPFYLVYGQEALQPIELNTPTIKLTGRQEQNNDEAWIHRLLNLVELEWKREGAYLCYERKVLQLKDKLNEGLKDKKIKEKSLVLRYNNALDNRFDAKFERRREGPFIVKKAFTSGYYQMMDLNGKEHPRKVNGYRLKLYLSRILPAVFETKTLALNYYEEVSKKAQIKANEYVKDKEIQIGDLVLRYNSKLDNSFQKTFQIKWKVHFTNVNKFDNETYQLADLGGAEHKYRFNDYGLKKYLACLMTIVIDEMLSMQEESVKISKDVNEGGLGSYVSSSIVVACGGGDLIDCDSLEDVGACGDLGVGGEVGGAGDLGAGDFGDAVPQDGVQSNDRMTKEELQVEDSKGVGQPSPIKHVEEPQNVPIVDIAWEEEALRPCFVELDDESWMTWIEEDDNGMYEEHACLAMERVDASNKVL
ncbi:hypothetical protein L7F22_048248 [Adiantum nelumboides]|nr:hypothetical protein [Adiantum nelumboides]